MTEILRTPGDFIKFRKGLSGRVGFVPTMGALHAGHEELLKKAQAECDHVVLSIFVNPTQFNNPQDLEKYPATWNSDFAMAQKNKVAGIFFPKYAEMYPDDYHYKVIENDFSKLLCGADRPGHFDGVLSVVMKLFQIITPQVAYFGEKDFQQLTLIQGMVKAFFLPIEICPVPTKRESDGLAMSSRNVRLSAEQRKVAPELYKALTQSTSAEKAFQCLTEKGFKVDYVTDRNNRRFVAAYLGEVRLIDNVQI